VCIFLFEPELAILVELPVVFLADANTGNGYLEILEENGAFGLHLRG